MSDTNPIMEEKIIIKNFGPVKDLDVTIRAFTIFIGSQGSGKSTVSKVLTICRDYNWYLQILDNNENVLEPFKKFGIDEYFHDDTYIHYYHPQDEIDVEYKEGIFKVKIDSLSSVDARKVLSEKILEANKDFLLQMGVVDINQPGIEEKYGPLLQANARTMLYIPAERNMAGMLSNSIASMIANKIPIYDSLIEYMSVFEKAKATLKEYYVPFLDVSFAIKDGSEKVWLGKDKDKHEPLPLPSCSSGLQSVLPLLMSIDYSLNTRCFDNFAIEEPEQNLFPSNQRELLYYLVRLYNQTETYGMILTTHSPYTLSCMNVLMLAGKIAMYNSDLRSEVVNIVGENNYLSPELVAVYKLDPQSDKYCEDLKNPKTRLISMNSLDAVSEKIGEEYDKLFEIYLKELRKKK